MKSPATDVVGSRVDRGLFYGYLAVLVWVPLPLASARQWSWGVFEIAIGVIVLLSIILLERSRSTETLVKARPIFVLLLLWQFYGLLQIVPLPVSWLSLLSPKALEMHQLVERIDSQSAVRFATLSLDPAYSFELWVRSWAYVAVFYLTIALVSSRRRIRILIWVLVASALAQALYGSVMTLSGIEYGFFHKKVVYEGVATGTFINRNHFANYLVLCLAAGIGLLLADLGAGEARNLKQKINHLVGLLLSPRFLLRVFLAVIVVGVVLSHSRMGNTAFFVSLTLAGGIALFHARLATRSTIILLSSLIVIDLLIVGTWFGFAEVAQRLEETGLAREGRDEVLRDGLVLFKDYLWFGVGFGNFFSAFPAYRGEDVTRFYFHAHNDYLQFAIEGGVVAVLLVAVVVAYSFWLALQSLRVRRDPLLRGVAFASVMATLAVLIHATVEFNMQVPANALTYIVLLALPWIARYKETRGRARTS